MPTQLPDEFDDPTIVLENRARTEREDTQRLAS